jgi:hypothetical protein
LNNNTLLFHYSSDFIISQKKEGAELLLETHPALLSAPALCTCSLHLLSAREDMKKNGNTILNACPILVLI